MIGSLRMPALIALSLLTGCASVVNGPTQSVGVSSVPSGATVSVDGVEIGRTPMIAEIDRRSGHVVSLSKPPLETRELTLSRSTSAWVLGNAAFGYAGLIGVAVDATTGGLFKLHPAALDVVLAMPAGPGTPAAPDADDPLPSGPLPDASATLVPEGARTRNDGDGAVSRIDGTIDAAPAVAPSRSRREGLFVGAALGLSSWLPLPLPIVEIGYEFDRLGVRARIGALYVGRWALEASWALDPERRTRAYLTTGFENAIFNLYTFAGLGLERRLGRGDWFVQFDVTAGERDSAWYDDEDERRDVRTVEAGLSVGVRR